MFCLPIIFLTFNHQPSKERATPLKVYITYSSLLNHHLAPCSLLLTPLIKKGRGTVTNPPAPYGPSL